MNARTRCKLLYAMLVTTLLPGNPADALAFDTSPPKGVKVYHIAIHNFAFEPKNLTVAVGTYVVWTNRDEEPHVVTSAGALFASSAALDTGDNHVVRFSKPGSYVYFCSIHPMMVGTITVK
jgi:plastocyanin